MTPPVQLAEAAPAVWTCDDVAAYLVCSRRKVDYLRKREDFPRPITGFGHPRFRAADVIAWAVPVAA